MTDSWENVAARTWAVLTAYAAKKETLSYKNLGLEVGLHHRTVKFPLDVIYRYCSISGLPALTGIVVRQDSGMPGRGFTEWDDDLETGLARVFAENWSTRPIHSRASAVTTACDHSLNGYWKIQRSRATFIEKSATEASLSKSLEKAYFVLTSTDARCVIFPSRKR